MVPHAQVELEATGQRPYGEDGNQHQRRESDDERQAPVAHPVQPAAHAVGRGAGTAIADLTPDAALGPPTTPERHDDVAVTVVLDVDRAAAVVVVVTVARGRGVAGRRRGRRVVDELRLHVRPGGANVVGQVGALVLRDPLVAVGVPDEPVALQGVRVAGLHVLELRDREVLDPDDRSGVVGVEVLRRLGVAEEESVLGVGHGASLRLGRGCGCGEEVPNPPGRPHDQGSVWGRGGFDFGLLGNFTNVACCEFWELLMRWRKE